MWISCEFITLWSVAYNLIHRNQTRAYLNPVSACTTQLNFSSEVIILFKLFLLIEHINMVSTSSFYTLDFTIIFKKLAHINYK